MSNSIKIQNKYFLYFVSSIEKSRNSIISLFNRCETDFSEEVVHDLRVSMRRLLAFLKVLEKLIESNYIKCLKKELKSTIKSFNKLRDTQVQIQIVNKLKWNSPELTSFSIHLLNLEKILIQEIHEFIRSYDFDILNGLIFFLKLKLKEMSADDKVNEQTIINILNDLLGELTAALDIVDPKDPKTIHRVRLIFKNFRYAIELFDPLLKFSKNISKKLKSYQTLMGEIQDWTVLDADINNYLFQNSFPFTEISLISGFVSETLHERVNSFFEIKQQLYFKKFEIK
ncbi:MAG: CHAD domain-containing protein [Candidatus Kapabacteria bacterium]|nr:CHAD domain-containing protein [Candidatus Kapabacteria bacterium]